MSKHIISALPNVAVITLIIAIAGVALSSGCTSSQHIGGKTGTGAVYGEVLGIEHYTEWACDNWLVYFRGDPGSGGDSSNPNHGSYCFKDNDPALIDKLTKLADKGAYVKAKYETAYVSLCGCDYSAWITEVSEVEKVYENL